MPLHNTHYRTHLPTSRAVFRSKSTPFASAGLSLTGIAVGVRSVGTGESEPSFGDGDWEPAISDVRLLISQATTENFDDLELFISRRADLRRTISRMTGGIGA